MRFKSIFTRLLITYLLLTLAVTSSLALLLSYGFNHYVFTEKQRVLQAAASKVENLVNSYYQGQFSQEELQIALDNLGFISDSTIYALKVDKNQLHSAQNQKLEAEIAEGYLLEDLLSILDGGTVYRKKQFSRAMDTDVVFLGAPLEVGHQIIGAVLVFSPLSEINTYLKKINLIIGGTALAAIIISFFFIYISASRISRPIREMGKAARQLAAGEASPELSIKTGDEVEELASSFNYMRDQLVATEHMRREFIANVSHELRTPLTSINGFVQGIRDGLVKPEQYPKYLGLIQDETRRLMRLTGDILELAKIQSGYIKITKHTFPAGAIINEVINSFILSGTDVGITITALCAPEVKVLADPDRLRQVLTNLIGNAVRHSGLDGMVTVQAEQENDKTVFKVSDTGTGIAPEDLPYIFERFYRGENRRPGSEGSGLGLCIVKNLVELQGGCIRAESQIGIGTSIFFCLPTV